MDEKYNHCIEPGGSGRRHRSTDAPSATLGPYSMTAFPLDAGPIETHVTSVASPLGGQVDFSIPMVHELVGIGWLTWSHGYTGDVYWTDGATSVTMTLPTETKAFYFYAEPNPMAQYTIVATAQDGTQVGQNISGNAGAAYYGFYGTDGSFINSITVTTPQSVDFSVGEFGTPAPKSTMKEAQYLGMKTVEYLHSHLVWSAHFSVSVSFGRGDDI
ncbi:MAG: hypothetical protein NTZ17_02590 [Phycisphaerae bacterium]|nr:hypothetical protein [Phycisphaerae bacterium]